MRNEPATAAAGPATTATRSVVPPLQDPRFWVVQAMVVVMAAAHLVIDATGVLRSGPFPASTTVGFMLLPVGYAAVHFGFRGSLATAVWTAILWLPDLLLPDGEGQPFGDLVQLALVIAVAIFVGRHIEAERQARARAEEAETAHARAELRARSFALRVLDAEEQERRRIAQELHDEPVQLLAYLAQRLGAGGSAGASADREPGARASADREPGAGGGGGSRAGGAMPTDRQVVLDVLDNLRRISRGLRPAALDELGLVPALSAMVAEAGRTSGIDLRFDGPAEAVSLPPELELAVFRICQEALHNAVRHAGADLIEARLRIEAGRVVVRVSDDGEGFEAGGLAADGHRGLGLVGMRERADLLGGELEVSSAPGSGTVVRASLPVGRPAGARS
ncbi:MAG: sensor histidine kinase [Acidimicrobiales bacterium]